MELNNNIEILENTKKTHSKASEEYIAVRLKYPEKSQEVWVPVKYRRTGLDLEKKEEINEYLNIVYEQMKPENKQGWLELQEEFWRTEKSKAYITKSFFDKLKDGEWKCVHCKLPTNPNFARRIQDLKEAGYTIATDTNRYCENCEKYLTHLLLLPIERGGMAGNGYETWSPALRNRIIKVLNSFDVYEHKKSAHLLPDHKFPEIRWDHRTKEENLDSMTDDEIKKKFQLLSNQRNQQKREVCRTCYHTGKRGTIYGISYYYEGGESWDDNIPETGRDAEPGCYGCPWYDIEVWRDNLVELIEVKHHEK